MMYVAHGDDGGYGDIVDDGDDGDDGDGNENGDVGDDGDDSKEEEDGDEVHHNLLLFEPHPPYGQLVMMKSICR